MSTKNTAPTRAETSLLALAAAQNTLTTRQAEHDTAVALLDELTDRLDSGDDTVGVSDLGAARDAVDRASRLLAAGEAAVATARRALINDDTEVADEVADVLAELYGDLVPVKVVAIATDTTPSPKGTPTLWVVQTTAGTNDGGELAGTVDVVMHRGPLLAALDADELTEACTRRGHLVDVTERSTSTHARKRSEDTLRVRVRSAFPSVPLLDVAPDAEALRYFGTGVAARLLPAVTHPGDVRKGYAMSGEHTRGPVVKLVSSTPSRAVTDADGITHQSVTYHLTAEETRKATGNAMPRISATLTDNRRVTERNAGRVVSVTVDDIQVPDARPHQRQRWSITVTMVLAYRTR